MSKQEIRFKLESVVNGLHIPTVSDKEKVNIAKRNLNLIISQIQKDE